MLCLAHGETYRTANCPRCSEAQLIALMPPFKPAKERVIVPMTPLTRALPLARPSLDTPQLSG